VPYAHVVCRHRDPDGSHDLFRVAPGWQHDLERPPAVAGHPTIAEADVGLDAQASFLRPADRPKGEAVASYRQELSLLSISCGRRACRPSCNQGPRVSEIYAACGFDRIGRCDASGVAGPVGTYVTGDLELPAMEMRKE